MVLNSVWSLKSVAKFAAKTKVVIVTRMSLSKLTGWYPLNNLLLYFH